ncbi:MAG: D-alanine--poly(phosphoribitol) ligase subunit DltA [Liquorilactobacillus ghanensis]|uniref:D-alanine--poly(phosphoribitol) ligase subunit DltA n=1 Tax=Liquorilactobacillus ghanensis TaxID=399370 RepID=UPI0039ED375B
MTENLISKLTAAIAQSGQNTAYDELGKQHTYHELQTDVQSLAGFLEKDQLDHCPILVFGDHQFEMIATFLGCAFAGHPYIPVDSSSSLPRIKSILATADPKIIVLIDDFPFDADIFADRKIIKLKQLHEIFQQHYAYKPLTIPETTPFYILFTSGTTGSPKGVPISHQNINLFISWLLSPEFGVPQHAAFLGQVPYSFDVSNMYWLSSVLSGGTIKALPREAVNDFGTLFRILPQLDFQVFVGTPSLAEMFCLSPDFKAEKKPNLQLFLLCGEELTVKLAKKLAKRFPDARIFNTYGPTEATVAVSAWEVDKTQLPELKRIPLGKAEPQVTLSIQNEGSAVKQGEIGEIIISGPCVSSGYLNNPEKTKAAFFELDGQPAYHTGDLGHYGDDGLLYYHGRCDFQIKLHGFRIELDEVRASLEKSSYIKQAVAVPKYDRNQRPKHLVAYIIANPNDFEAKTELIQAIRQELQGVIMPYMMPTEFIFSKQLPLSPNGKIDVKQLIKEANS